MNNLAVPLECCFCSMVCSNRNAMEAHMGTDHFNYDPFQCEECRLAGRHAKFPTEFLLKQHCFSEHKLKEFYFRTWVSAEIEEKRTKICDSLNRCPAAFHKPPPPFQPGLIIPPVPASFGAFHTVNQMNKVSSTLSPTPSVQAGPPQRKPLISEKMFFQNEPISPVPPSFGAFPQVKEDALNPVPTPPAQGAPIHVQISPKGTEVSPQNSPIPQITLESSQNDPNFKKNPSNKTIASEPVTELSLQNKAQGQMQRSLMQKLTPSHAELSALLGSNINHILVDRIHKTVAEIANPDTFKDPAECLHFMLNLYKSCNADPMHCLGQDIGSQTKKALKLLKSSSIPEFSEVSPDTAPATTATPSCTTTSSPHQSNMLVSIVSGSSAKKVENRRVSFAENIENIEEAHARKTTVSPPPSTTSILPMNVVILEANPESAPSSKSTSQPAVVLNLDEAGKTRADSGNESDTSSSSGSSIVCITLEDDSDQEDCKIEIVESVLAEINCQNTNIIEAVGNNMDDDDHVVCDIKPEQRQKAKKTLLPTEHDQAKRFRTLFPTEHDQAKRFRTN